MTNHDGPWPTGTPSWTDLQVADVAAARGFYASLLGWDIEDGPEDAGGYLMALLNGRPVAGIGPKTAEDPTPSAWMTYLATDDADATAKRIVDAGGSVFMPPFDVLDVGRMTVAADAGGAVFGVWQGTKHQGAGIVNEPGALCWNEVHTRHYAATTAFYSTVYGYDFAEIGDGEHFTYSVAALTPGGPQIAGVLDDPALPEGVDGYWLTWFAVADVDGAAVHVTHLGGRIVAPPADSPFGRMAIATGAQGETFGLIALD
ncbi:VOC family protein [Leifsonia lichenia]